ncbi:MAG: DUF4890 domain-containing protein [Tannerellaceae bacterium]|nr:DUF4890 domain-containing protein [Tannerellaceae bacterium]
MKSIKRVSLMLAAVFTLGGVAMASEAREGRKGMDPKAHAEKMTERMVKEYNLDDTQKQQVLDLNQAMAEKMGNRPMMHRHGKKGKPEQMDRAQKGDKDAKVKKEREERKNKELRADRGERKNRKDAPELSAGEREKRMQEMKKMRDDYSAQLQKIMNQEQYQAYAQKQADRQQKRQERGEKMKEHRSKRGAAEKKNEKV